MKSGGKGGRGGGRRQSGGGKQAAGARGRPPQGRGGRKDRFGGRGDKSRFAEDDKPRGKFSGERGSDKPRAKFGSDKPRGTSSKRDEERSTRHPEARGASRRASKDDGPRREDSGRRSFEGRLRRPPQDDGSRVPRPVRAEPERPVKAPEPEMSPALMQATKVQTVVVTPDENGMRVDRFVRGAVPGTFVQPYPAHRPQGRGPRRRQAHRAEVAARRPDKAFVFRRCNWPRQS